MSAYNPLKEPDPGRLLAVLEARYDCSPPRRARLSALAGGDGVLCGWASQARHQRLLAQCTGARLALARRRRQLPADAVEEDAWLRRLTGDLRAARDGLAAG